MNNKTIIESFVIWIIEYHMKNYGDLGGFYPPQPMALTENTLLDLHNSSYDTHWLLSNLSPPQRLSLGIQLKVLSKQ